MKVGYRNTCGEDRAVRVLGCEGCSGLGGEFIEFDGADTRIDSLNNLLSDDYRINKLSILKGGSIFATVKVSNAFGLEKDDI